MKIKAIVAMDDDGLIGIDNKLPWNIPEDLEWFKKLTLNSFVIMGSKTWKSLPKRPLVDRDCMILTRDCSILPFGKYYYFRKVSDFVQVSSRVAFTNNVDELLKVLSSFPSRDKWVIGGASVYKEFLDRDLLDEIWVTHVHGSFAKTREENVCMQFPGNDYIVTTVPDGEHVYWPHGHMDTRWNKKYLEYNDQFEFDHILYERVR